MTYISPDRALGGFTVSAPNATPLGKAAIAILAALPPDAFTNPITPEMADAKGQVRNPADGRYEDFYMVYPIEDASGLFVWTGPNSYQENPGLTAAQHLAVVAGTTLAHGGSVNFLADFFPNAAYAADVANVDPNAPAETSVTAVPVTPPPAPAPPAPTPPQPAPASAGGTNMVNVDPVIPDGAVLQAIDAVVQQGGDPTQPTAITDTNSGATVVAQQLPNGSVKVSPPTSAQDIAGIVNSVTGFVDHLAGTIQDVSTEVKHIGNAIQGAATGAAAGYNAPIDWKPIAIGAGAVVGVLYVLSKLPGR